MANAAHRMAADLPIINSDLLSEFEPNLLSHTVSIFNLLQMRVNAYSLATKTGFFCKRYLDVATGAAQEPLVLTRDDVASSAALKIVMYFCHFDRLRDMDISLLRETLTAAVQFECKDLERYATEFAVTQLSIETAIAIWQQVGALPDLPVAETVRTFVLRHFLSLTQREDFPQLSLEVLTDLLRDDRLNIWQEDQLIEPLLRWTRGRATPLWDQMRLLAGVRFNRLSQRARAELRQLDGFKYFLGFRRSPMFSGMCQSDELRISHEGVLLLGGTFGEVPTGRAAYLDPRSGRVWAQLAPRFCLPEPRLDFACAVLGDCRVFVAGGQKGPQRMRHTAECLCLDLRFEAASWQPVAALHEARSGLSAVVCNSVLYVVGGENQNGYLATFESLEETQTTATSRYSRWRLHSPLPEGRSEPGVASVGDRIVACGGYRGNFGERQACTLVHWYDPAVDQWTRLTPMRYPRAGASLLALEPTQLLVLGGNMEAPAERLQFFTGGPPRWVSAAPAPPQLQLACSAACVADSRWLLADRSEHDDHEPLSSSSIAAVPVERLTQASSGRQRDLADSVSWLPHFGFRDFGLVTVAGLQAVSELLGEAAPWPHGGP